MSVERPWPKYNVSQINFIICKKLNIPVSSAANLASKRRPLLKESRKWLCLFFLLVKIADTGTT